MAMCGGRGDKGDSLKTSWQRRKRAIWFMVGLTWQVAAAAAAALLALKVALKDIKSSPWTVPLSALCGKRGGPR